MAEVRENEVSISIPWRPWTKESFALAHERNVPIMLSISAVWCHWCHIMDRDTYRSPEVIRRVTEETVPIRVDADRRPDINNRYNLGGWPTTAFLTPDGDLLTGGTFMPEDALLDTLSQVNRFLHESRNELERRLESRRARRARISELRHRLRGDVTPETIEVIIQATKEAYDKEHGGFGQAPKFPLPDTIDLALAVGQAWHDETLLDIARTTLTAMVRGGLYDPVEGGFFRYSTAADWSDPHHEKRLESNARLLSTYLQAAQVFASPLYWDAARGTLTLVEGRLQDPDTGTFGGSVAADEEYYHLPPYERGRRPPPAVDPTLFTDWNAMMISAFLQAAAVLDIPYYAELALEALEAIWSRTFIPEAGMAHYYDGSPHLPGLLSDLVWMAQALLDAQAYTGADDYLQRAETLMDIAQARLLDPDVGGFYDIPFDPAALGRLQERFKLLPENAVAADVSLRLHRLTGQEKYYEAAVGTLEALAPLYRPYRYHAAAYGLAVYRFVHPVLHFILVGDPGAELSRSLRLVALSIYDPNRLVETVDPAQKPGRLQELGLPSEPQPALYIRRGPQTSGPIRDPAQVRAAVQAAPA